MNHYRYQRVIYNTAKKNSEYVGFQKTMEKRQNKCEEHSSGGGIQAGEKKQYNFPLNEKCKHNIVWQNKIPRSKINTCNRGSNQTKKYGKVK